MNEDLNQIISMLPSLSPDELLHLRDEIDDYLEERDTEQADQPDNNDLEPVPKSATGRYAMPRIRKLYEWGAVKDGDRLYVVGHESEPATLTGRKEVEYNGERMSVYAWAKAVTGWKSINIYMSVILEREGRPLWEVRRDAMIANGMEYPED